jgi:hypothetical protein
MELNSAAAPSASRKKKLTIYLGVLWKVLCVFSCVLCVSAVNSSGGFSPRRRRERKGNAEKLKLGNSGWVLVDPGVSR